MFVTGLTSISFRNLSVDEIIRLTRESGLKAIEWGSDIHAPKDNAPLLKDIREKMERAGLYTSSYGTYFRIGESSLADLPDYICAASILGTKILRLWCGRKNYEDMDEAERKRIIEEAGLAASIAEQHGVVFCVECHKNTFTSCLFGALRLMETVNSSAFRMYWQPSLLLDEAGNTEYADKISKYTQNIHVFNWSEKGRIKLREGFSAWQKYLSFFDGTQHLLLEFMPDNSPASLAEEAEAVIKLADGFNK